MTDVLVCCGVGGTGKTTTAAGIAVAQARAGKRTVVLTIDPARRLAAALGVELGNTPTPIVGLAATDPHAAPLHGLMLDRKGTWDAIIHRYASSPDRAERLIANPYYRSVATRLTGSHEYMAVEKLYELVSCGEYDLVVLDTPPAQHVVDFFEAPERIHTLLEKGTVSALLRPRSGLIGAATRQALRIVERLAGDQVMQGITEFFDLFSELSDGLRERSAAVRDLLRSERTQFLLITDASAPERSDVMGFLDELRSRQMQFAGFIVNRTAPDATITPPLTPRELIRPTGWNADDWGVWTAAVLDVPMVAAQRAQVHSENANRLASRAPGAPLWRVPEVPGGIHTIGALIELGESLPPQPPKSR